VVDDHVLIRDALRGVLTELQEKAEILNAANAHQCLQLVEEHADLDLILLDLGLPDRDGFSLLAELRRRFATAAVIVLSASNEREKIKRAFDLGAVGFIPKATEREVMLNALQLVFSGGIYIPKEILDYEPPSQPHVRSGQSSNEPEFLSALGLTNRQAEVLVLIMQGKSNKAIARILNMAEPTVKNHVTAILKALKAANRTEAVIKLGQMERNLSGTES
jgi:DNA-binding NarL/FixJ family response regulator